ncbi:MAG: acyltransferase [Oscillospiraceae bacterium]|nr:acyltransferase [Oscillospiraceae bacterium]
MAEAGNKTNGIVKNGRIESIDAAKGILLIVVLISHGCGFLNYRDWFCACYMCAFFVLSGYTGRRIAPDSAAGIYLSQCKKNAVRFLKPYFGWTAAILAIDSINRLTAGSFSASRLLHDALGSLYSRYCLYPLGSEPNVYFLDKNGALWFLTCFLCARLIFIGAMYLINREKTAARTALVMLTLLAASVCLSKLPILLPWSIDTAFAGAFFMLAGYLYRDWETGRTEKRTELPSADEGRRAAGSLRTDRILGAAVLGVFYLMLVPANGYINMSVRIYGDRGVWSVPLFLLVGLSGTALYAALGKLLSLIRPVGRFLSYVSKSAFALLAMQFEIYALLGRIMPVPEFSSGSAAYMYGLLQAALNLLICLGIHACIAGLKRVFSGSRNGGRKK